MISIPIWAFALLCIGTGIFGLITLFFVISLLGSVERKKKQKDNDCPYKIEIEE